MQMSFRHLTGIELLMSCALALLLDLCIGDPQTRFHPIRVIGWLIGKLERLLYRDKFRVMAGCLLVLLMVSTICSGTELLLTIAGCFGRYAQVAMATLLVWATVAPRDLFDHAERVRLTLQQGDLTTARSRLAAMVSRDTANLDETQIARGCVESVAENLVDGVISPLFFALIGGPVLAYAFKVVSTLDSMVGYKNEQYREFGWASARSDDVLNYIPARLLLAILPVAALFGPYSPRACLRTMWRDGDKNPSPNSGIPEAGFAGALGIQLGGSNVYAGIASLKPVLNPGGHPANALDIRRAQRLLILACLITFSILLPLRLLF